MPLPPKPKGTPDDLHEVERALSVLKGRHPEHERAQREDEEKRRRRAAELDTRAASASSAARSRAIRFGAIGIPVVALLAFFGLLVRREMSRREHVERVSQPFRAFGFATVESSSPSTTGALEASLEPGCALALSTGNAPLVLTRPGGPTTGPGPILFCTCAPEKVSIASKVAADGGLVLMRADAAMIGGSRAFAFVPFKPGTTLRSDEGCSDAALDAWIDGKHAPAPSLDGPWLTAWPARAPLVAAGFKVAADLGPPIPFVVVDLPKESCVIAASSAPSDRLILRAKGAAAPLVEAAGSFARCAQEGGTVMLERTGTGEVALLVAPAAAAGGAKGTRELARDSDLALAQIAVAAADRPWDAKQTLLASMVPEALITVAGTPDVAVDKDARVAALSFDTANALAPETAADFFSYCEPSLEPTMREAVCVFSGAQKWRTEGAEAAGGIARSKLPSWLFTMQGANDPQALKGITQLFALARKLGRDGFAPTTLEALTELPTGVEVLGRMREDAVVAVGVAATPPWVYPLSDGPPWTLDEPPRIVPVKPLEKVTLTTPLKKLPPKGSRRTVVFRRQLRTK